ncbi:EF-hand domain-containing protein [Pelagibacterium xiamenense]|uniref:EF-hand domain-containing protein n=1 Tax=Pelagibacterium xiamenense TaxID=2901140 RepID=UPI001E4A1162|nr:EF-hand domain-containing protein [Pelagibacterium xiamenense]MCD7059940.1 EF-hand domain-containing protein [Pelagibacterium xiamenense]
MKATLLSATTLLGLAFAGSAVAQGVDFASLDADMNGEISFEELQAALPNIVEEDFSVLDVDGSGGLSEDEFATLVTPPSGGADTTTSPQ